MRVFIENEAGSRTKNLHNDVTFAPRGSTQVSLPYPYPYGFVIGTVGGDGDAVDCFVLTDSELASGDIIDCNPVGFLEKVEDGEIDNKVLSVPANEHRVLDHATVTEVTAFTSGFSARVAGKQMETSRLLGSAEAHAYVETCRKTSAPGEVSL